MEGAIVAKVNTLDDLRASLKFAEAETEEYGTLYNYWAGRVKELRRDVFNMEYDLARGRLTTPPTTSGEEGGR